LNFHTETHRAYVHITPQVEEILCKSGVKEGMMLVSAMHITAGVYVNDNESGLIEDIDQWLEHLAPFRKDYKHHNTGEDNGDSTVELGPERLLRGSGRIELGWEGCGNTEFGWPSVLRHGQIPRQAIADRRIIPDSQPPQVAHGGGSLPLGLLN